MRVEQKSDRGWRVQSAGIFPFFSLLLRVLLNSLSISIGIVTATVQLLSPAQTRKASIKTQSGDELPALFSFQLFTIDIKGFWDILAEKCNCVCAYDDNSATTPKANSGSGVYLTPDL
jgi:hypothetical protein